VRRVLRAYVIEAGSLGGLVTFLRRSLEDASLVYAFTGEEVGRVKGRGEVLAVKLFEDARGDEEYEPPRLERVKRFLNKEEMRRGLNQILERLSSIKDAGLAASVIIDTNVAISGYLELLLEELKYGGYTSRVIVPKMVIQELFQQFTTNVYKGRRYEEAGIRGFPKARSREARYALSVIMRGLREGFCRVYGRLIFIAAGEGGYEYLSDLAILEQAEEYARSWEGASIFLTSDFALSAISTIPVTKYLKPPAGRSEGPLDPAVLEQLAVALGILEVVSENLRFSLAYSWKGITLEDYYERRLAIATSDEVIKELRRYVTLYRELSREEAPWLKLLERD